MEATLTRETFEKQYKNILEGNSQWQKIPVKTSVTFDWKSDSTYVRLIFSRHRPKKVISKKQESY